MDEIIEDFKRELFGEDAKLTEIQQIHVTITLLDDQLRRKKGYTDEQKSKMLEILFDHAEELETEVDKVMPAEDSPNFIKYRVIKAYTFYVRGYLSCGSTIIHEDLKFLEQAMEILKPIKLTHEALYYYYLVLHCFASIYKNTEEKNKVYEFLKEQEETLEAFKEKFPDCVHKKYGNQILFDTIVNFDKTFTQLMYTSKVEMFGYYQKIACDKEMALKYALEVVFAFDTHINGDATTSQSVVNFISLLYDALHLFIAEFCFPQLNHFLAVIFFQLVKYRRTLPEDKKHEIDEAMGDLSQLYADWAYEIVDYSLKWRYDKAAFEKKHPIDQKVVILEKFVEPGVEAYANQFPCEPIVYREDIMKTLRKGKAWCQRAIDLYEVCPEKQSTTKMQMDGFNLGLNCFKTIDLPERGS
ncbi:uncharacterized protein LOC134831389 [Culicoides brevitarsis]|uniref:uncharacterized protein LOC134831389 n=1 Tax=Culicoides brevitarsis TaxID=469753 RepID=UPI00307C906C